MHHAASHVAAKQPTHRALGAAGVLLVAALSLAGCGTGGTASPTHDVAIDQLNVLADMAESEFAARGDGQFYDTGFLSYCRLNTDFDTGIFKVLGFDPTGEARTGYEYCYNVSDDRMQVALAATSARDGSVRCLILDASSGSVVRGSIDAKDPCIP